MSLTTKLRVMRLIKNPSFNDSKNIALSHDMALYLLKALESADKSLYADIENDLVDLGEDAIKPLIKSLNHKHPKVRSCAAMALIRIGNKAIDPLMKEYLPKQEYHWMLEYIVSEINGSDDQITKTNTKDLKASVAG